MGSLSKQEFDEYIKEECFGNSRGLRKLLKLRIPSIRSVYLIRKMQYKSDSKSADRICRKLANRYGIFVHPHVKIGKGLHLPHPNGIIIGTDVEIGNNATIFQQVTIGSAHMGVWKVGGMQPILKDNVVAFAGCKIIGKIVVEEGTTIAANAVLTKSTEKNSTWAGIPAHMVHHADK